MKRLNLVLILLLSLVVSTGMAQTMAITNPVLTSPYQVSAGTVVTFEWDAFGSAPTKLYSHTSAPTISQGLPPNSAWTEYTNWTGPTNGKYYLNITVNSDLWVFGGISGFIGWQYSNVLPIQTISGYSITSSDNMICPTNGSVVFTAPSGTGYTYTWHDANGPITGQTSSTYTATSSGSYYSIITVSGTPNTTNTLTITDYVATFTGSLASNQVTMTADQTFGSYQWYERTGTGTATAINGATSSSYAATISASAINYSYEGTSGTCTVTSSERLVIDTLFMAPTLTLFSSPNPQGFVCDGTPVSIKADGNSGNYIWYRNGQQSSSGSDSINIWGAYQNGSWTATVSPTEWPNILITSNAVTVSILDLIDPSISGGNFYNYFCAGDVINMILTDEGYTYTWYVHDTANVYGPTDLISVPNGVYQHAFTATTYVTIVAEFNGCSTSKSIYLKSWSEKSISVSIDNYDQQYLCTDSTVTLSIPSWDVANFTNFQWYELIGTTWTAMANQNASSLAVINPGEYKVEANPVSCSTAISSSYPKTIYSYLDRQPYIYARNSNICEGDTTVLQLSGGSNWYAKQWLQSDINIGQGGYERSYVGMLTNSGSDTQEVYEYNSFQISAKHISCPNGLKTKSNIAFVKPTLNPEIIQTGNFVSEPKHVIDWDSTNHIIGCVNEPIQLTLSDLAYDSIIWFVEGYMGDDDYVLGTQFHVGDTASNTMDAKWITAVVTDGAGCRGQSTPILLDARVFQDPAVASFNNSELCNVGDSALMHLAFPGTWVAYQWYLNGSAIPGATNDSIWGKLEGEYVLNAFPAACPTFEYTSGVGPIVKFLYSEILENDTLIYAMPELGAYSYQWFLNGDSIDGDPNRAWVIMKDSLVDGIYTVAVSNDNCTKISPDYIWTANTVNEIVSGIVTAFPNPTTGIIKLQTTGQEQVKSVSVLDVNGRIVHVNTQVKSTQIDISSLDSGMYFMKIELESGSFEIVRISKQ